MMYGDDVPLCGTVVTVQPDFRGSLSYAGAAVVYFFTRSSITLGSMYFTGGTSSSDSVSEGGSPMTEIFPHFCIYECCVVAVETALVLYEFLLKCCVGYVELAWQ